MTTYSTLDSTTNHSTPVLRRLHAQTHTREQYIAVRHSFALVNMTLLTDDYTFLLDLY
jgi:hypothetical protein